MFDLDINSIQHLTYLGIILLFLFSSLVPVPEEMVLLFVGYGAAAGFFNLWPALILAIIGAFIGDFILYYFSKQGSRYISRLAGKINQQKVSKYEDSVEDNTAQAVFFSRFMPGLRFPAIILSGSMNISIRQFLLFDGLALLIYGPLLILLGYHFHNEFTNLLTTVDEYRHWISIAVIILVGLLASVAIKRFFKKS